MDVAHRFLPARWLPAAGGTAVAEPTAGAAGLPKAPAAGGNAADTEVCPTWARVFDASPASPIVVGAALAGGLALAFLGLDLAEGNLAALFHGEASPFQHVEVRSAVIVSLLLAGVVVTHRFEVLGTRRDLERLAPQLDESVLAEAGRALAASPGRRRLRVAGLVGASVIVALVPALYLDPSRFLRIGTFALPSVWLDLTVGAVLGFTVGKTLLAAFDEDRRFARLAAHVRTLDLLDLRPLEVFGRRGLRRALRWLLLVSLASLIFVDAGTAAPPALVLAGIVGTALLAFLLPIIGVHRRLAREKARELEEIRGRIADERKRLRAINWRPAEDGGRFADLLAYEGRLAMAHTWPVDGTTLLRLGLYVLLPVGSWIASALVARGVERLFP